MTILTHGRQTYLGTAAERAGTTPDAEAVGVRFFETDTGDEYVWDGSSWTQVGGSLAVHDHSTVNDGGQNLRAIDEFELDDASALTISAGGAITRTQVYHSVDTNGAAALDNLDTINGGGDAETRPKTYSVSYFLRIN